MAQSLPTREAIVVIDKISPNGKEKILIVQQRTIHLALMILQELNHYYSGIEINREMIREVASQGEIELEKEIENLYDTSNCNSILHFN